MRQEARFIGHPASYNDDTWRQLAQVVVGHDEVEIVFVVDLPAIGEGDYDQQVQSMFRVLVEQVQRLCGAATFVGYGSRTGGLNAQVGFIVRQPGTRGSR